MKRYCTLSFKTALLSLFLLAVASGTTWAQSFPETEDLGFDGKDVLLLVGPNESTANWRARYLAYLGQLGAEAGQYRVFRTEKLPEEILRRLGLAPNTERFGALVRWGNPARFGPSRILPDTLHRSPQTDQDIFSWVEAAVRAAGETSRLSGLSPELQDLRPGARLQAVEHGFEANGHPLYLVESRLRLLNSGNRPARNVSVIFWVQEADGGWYELGRHDNVIVPPGRQITRNLVRETHDTPLLNENKEVVSATYRIVVEWAGEPIEVTGNFEPALLIDQPSR